jgi:hypothetical protein
MSLDGCRWLSRSDSLPRPGHGLILVELTWMLFADPTPDAAAPCTPTSAPYHCPS